MIVLSAVVSIFLLALGLGGYYLSDAASQTALIPAAFGMAILMLALYGREPDKRRSAMHLAMGIALVGILGSFSGLVEVVRHGQVAGLRGAALSRALMSAALILYVAVGARSFIKARQRRGQ